MTSLLFENCILVERNDYSHEESFHYDLDSGLGLSSLFLFYYKYVIV